MDDEWVEKGEEEIDNRREEKWKIEGRRGRNLATERRREEE